VPTVRNLWAAFTRLPTAARAIIAIVAVFAGLIALVLSVFLSPFCAVLFLIAFLVCAVAFVIRLLRGARSCGEAWRGPRPSP
jgi:ABC-type siderophore export system fused ATPase/permease subunit